MQVGKAALDDPALAPEARAVGGAATGDPVADPPRPQEAPVVVVVIATVGEQAIGLSAGSADLAPDRAGGQVVEQRQELGDVVAVTAGQRDGQRDPGRIDQEVVL